MILAYSLFPLLVPPVIKTNRAMFPISLMNIANERGTTKQRIMIENSFARRGNLTMLRGENVQETKNPRVNHPGIPFFIPIARLPIREERDFFLVRAGLPALGSSSGRPSHHNDSGFAAFVPDHGGGSAADFHRFPLRPI